MKSGQKDLNAVSDPVKISDSPGTIQSGIIADPFVANAAISSSISPMAFVDVKTEVVVYVNHSFLAVWGYESSREVIGKSASLFWDTQIMKGNIGKKISDTGGWVGEITGYCKDGSQLPLQISATILVDSSALPVFQVLSFLDISERVNAQNEQRRLMADLQERVKELRCLYNILSIKRDRETTVVQLLQHIVSAIPSSLRWPESAYARIVIGDIDVHSSNFTTSSSLLVINFDIGTQTGFLEAGYYPASGADTELKLLKEEEDLLRAASKEIIRLIEQKRDEDELNQNRERLLHADKLSSIGILSTEIMHEIGNPNNFIALNARILSRAWEDTLPILDMYYREMGDFSVSGLPYTEARKEIVRLIEGIIEGSERIGKISSHLRTFVTKKNSGVREVFSLNEAVLKAIAFSRNSIDSSTDNFTVTLTRENPLIKGDSAQIQQVVINLLSNASQALTTREGQIRISTVLDKEESTARVIVEDEGCGISQKDMARIMDPFFTTKNNRGSTGLGLSISNDIAVSHGGKLLIHSVEYKGTRVELFLPIQKKGENR
jgi:PAS domain S-box-containing protein